MKTAVPSFLILAACSGPAGVADSGPTDSGTIDAVADGSQNMCGSKTRCGTTCADLGSDVNNCGQCGTACGSASDISCLSGVCTVTCVGTRGNCDANVANGCETALATDAKNCGACGHDCLGASCVGGKCQPLLLANVTANTRRIALNSSSVFWIDSGSVRSCAKTGCNGQPATLAAQQDGYADLAADNANVYWTDRASGEIRKCAVAGCNMTPVVLATGQGEPIAIAMDGVNVYWTNKTAKLVQECATSGCNMAPTTLATLDPSSFQFWGGITTDGTRVYFGDGHDLKACAVGGCSSNPTKVLAGVTDAPSTLVVDGSNVYFANNDRVQSCSKGGCQGAPTTLGSLMIGNSYYATYSMAVDASDVYWVTPAADTIWRCAIKGCNGNPTPFITGNYPWAVATDAQAIYWVSEIAVMKLAK